MLNFASGRSLVRLCIHFKNIFMATTIKLSTITQVDLRECWQSESSDFTPWLAKEENMKLLAESLNIDELEVVAQEEYVGPYRADILCKEQSTDKYVLIENQLEKTDHTHLGQIMTYAAGLDAATIIWIAERFTEEHRAAIDWLNNITNKEFNFFGIEIKLIKIGDSPAAPVFNVIAKPNDWSKSARSVSSQKSMNNKTDTEEFRYEFWLAFNEFMADNPSKDFRPQSASDNHWMNIAVGTSKASICLLLNKRNSLLTVQLYLNDDKNKKMFDALFSNKDQAEEAISVDLQWRRLDGKKSSTIDLCKHFDDVTDKSIQKEMFSWYKEYTEKFVQFFKPKLKNL